MSTRDELFAVLERAIVGKTSIVGAREATQAVINAGWRPPMRVASTVDELEALPEGSTILDVDDSTWQSAYAETGYDWTSRSMTFDSEYLVLMELGPFRVVWEPEGEA